MKLFIKRILSYVPTPLPVGMKAWAKFSAEVIELTGPIANAEDLEAGLAMEVLHGAAAKSKVPKAYFVNRLRKVAANQIASAAFQAIKTRRDAQIAALVAKDKAEADEKNKNEPVQN